MDHVKLNVGNVVFIGAVSAGTLLAGMAFMHYFSRQNVPFLSPASRGLVDFTQKVAA